MINLYKIYHTELAEIALFGTDVATDWVNGYNLINTDEHIIWGTLMCVLPLMPTTIIGPLLLVKFICPVMFDMESHNWKCYNILAFLILFVPFVVITTPLYIGLVLYTGILKMWDPKHARRFALPFGLSMRNLVYISSVLRIGEIVTESCPQSMLGESLLYSWTADQIFPKLIDILLHPGIYIQTVLGPAKDPDARAFQYVGLAVSLASLVKGCSDWWVRQSRGGLVYMTRHNEPTLLETAQASLYFMPHILFRTTAMSFCAAFMGYYFLVPISFVMVIVIPIFFSLLKRDRGGLLVTLILNIIAPILFKSRDHFSRTLMKRTIAITTLILLMTLTFIRLLPVFVAPNDLTSTYGLCRLNFQSLPGAYLLPKHKTHLM